MLRRSTQSLGAWRLRRRTRCGVAALVAVLCAAAGCATDARGPAALSVPRASYELAFAAACEIAREEGFPPEVADERAGMIETAPKFAGSALEPWSWGDHRPSEVIEGTLGFERRRARFEFVPADGRPSTPSASEPLAGPILPGSRRGEGTDLLRSTADLEVRVSVAVERRFEPGFQGGAYTRALGSYWRDTTRATDPVVPSGRAQWTAVARDERLEQLLAARLAERLSSAAPAAPAAPSDAK